MQTVAQPRSRRNEGGRYSAKSGSDWYKAIEQANITAAEDTERALATALATQVGNAVAAMPDAASRIAKAATLVQERAVWPMSDGTFLVGSSSDTVKAYLVQRGPWACECKHAQYRDSLCSHVLAVQLTIKLGAQYTPSFN